MISSLIVVVLALAVALAGCSPAPRAQGVAAVVPPTAVPATRLPVVSSAPTVTLQPTLTGLPAGQVVFITSTPEATATPLESATPEATPTPHPDLPKTCNVAPPQNDFTISQGYVASNSVCRSAVISPDIRWLVFAQLVSGGDSEQVWLLDRETGKTTLITADDWQDGFYRAVSYYGWSSSNALLIVHRLINALAPAHIFYPQSAELYDLGTISSMFWSDDRQAIVGWAFEGGCVFSRITGWDFVARQSLQSQAPGSEVVGQVYFVPGTHDYLYTRSTMFGDCPQCVYRASELMLATDAGQTHEILLDDAQADYLLFGFSGDMVVLGRREYQSRACQDPSAVDDVPTTFLGYDLVTGELVPFDSAPESP